MTRKNNFLTALSDWVFVGKRLPLIIVLFVVAIASVSITVVTYYNSDTANTVTAYVTVEGLGEKDFENRQIKIADGETVADIFSLKYEKIYEDFGMPFVQYNRFSTFMGVRATDGKSFHVTIDGVFESNLTQAYVYGGQTVVISYY